MAPLAVIVDLAVLADRTPAIALRPIDIESIERKSPLAATTDDGFLECVHSMSLMPPDHAPTGATIGGA